MELATLAMIFAIVVGVPLGYLAARNQGRLLDTVVVSGSLLGVATPVFFLAILLKLVFADWLGWLPTSLRQDPRIDATHLTNFYVLDGLLTREWDAAWDAVLHLVLPAIALGTIPLAIIVRITRASVAEVLQRGLRAHRRVQGPQQPHRQPAPRAAQRPAAGGHHHRPAGRPAALRRGADRDRVRLQRGRAATCSRRSRNETSPSCRASSSSSPSSTP